VRSTISCWSTLPTACSPDPPYGMLTEIQPPLARHLPRLLTADGLVVVETDARTEPELPLPVRTSRKYGQTRVTLFEVEP
jgi:hypothetical protein